MERNSIPKRTSGESAWIHCSLLSSADTSDVVSVSGQGQREGAMHQAGRESEGVPSVSGGV